ncbi:MAG: type II secretion system major pseudopilin GspG [Desulfobacteraceae bacterium]|nr:type II secretion system major pseudopilin GspG [Desulfobacteraceae bacterium]
MHSDRQRERQRGFSLIELMIVIVILGLLASLVAPRLMGKLQKAENQTAKTQVEMLMTALDSYRLDMGHYPTDQEGGLEALVQNPGGDRWAGPYLKKGLPLDPWHNAYHYKCPGEHGDVDVFSYGADNQPGGTGDAADVVSWE